MKRYTLTLIVVLISQYAFGQISEGGLPVSFSFDLKAQEIPVITMPLLDTKTLLEKDEKARKENSQIPFKFGYAIDVDIDIKKDGRKIQLSNGDNMWLLKIHAPDAFSINLIYDNFNLAKESRFFIYNKDKTMVLGAFTPIISNNSYNEFATDLIQGNTIILEYYEPKNSDGGVIHIDKVIHGYVNTFSDFSDGLGTSASCNNDVNCPLGNNWENEKRAVSMILVDNNTAMCTGCLINNTRQNQTPFYLTANHCYFNNNGQQRSNPSTNIFRFKYWRPTCNGNNPKRNSWKSITGATILAHYAPTDFALLELKTTPPADYNLYYAGWDRTIIPAQNATAIHHPRGDVMKISYDANTITAITFPQCGNAQNHWRATFDDGIVQNGSSGSPLFNQAHRIVGQLHGNQNNQCYADDNTCHCNQKPIGEYGRFDISWTGGGTNSTRLSNWLDPYNLNVQVWNGSDCVTTFTDQTVSTSKTISDCYGLSIRNVTVDNGQLIINRSGQIIIDGPFEVKVGAAFEIR